MTTESEEPRSANDSGGAKASRPASDESKAKVNPESVVAPELGEHPHDKLRLAIATGEFKAKENLHWLCGGISWGKFCSLEPEITKHKHAVMSYVLGRIDPDQNCDCDEQGLHRNQQTILGRAAVTLDADFLALMGDGDGERLYDAIDLTGLEAFAYSTFSSTAGAQRWRLVFPTSREMTPTEYGHVARVLMKALGWSGEVESYQDDNGKTVRHYSQFDRGSEQHERFMYRQAAPSKESAWRHRFYGDLLDVDGFLGFTDPRPVQPIAEQERLKVDTSTPPSAEDVRTAHRALERLAEQVAATGEGGRNEALFAGSRKIYEYVIGGCIGEDAATEGIMAAGDECGLDHAEVLATIKSARGYAERDGGLRPSIDPYASHVDSRPDVEDVFTVDETFAGEEDDDWLSELGTEDGPSLFGELVAAVRRYWWLPNERDYDAFVLWAAATHAIDEFEHAPRLVIKAPEKECGKTRGLDVLEPLVSSPLSTMGATASAVTRVIARTRPTILLDEYDALFGTKRAAEGNEELRAIINSGHARGKPILKTETVKGKLVPKKFEVFSFFALAGIGSAPDTVRSRAIEISAARRPKDVVVSDFRQRRDGEGVLRPLGARLRVWVEAKIKDGSINRQIEVQDLRVTDRAADNWEPLIMVADAIGGEWPERARAAAVGSTEDTKKSGEESLSHRALRDLRSVWPDGATRVHSTDLVDALRELEEAPWARYGGQGGLDQNGLSFLLREYGIRTKNWHDRAQKTNQKAYFIDGWCQKPKAECDHKDKSLCQIGGGLASAWSSYLEVEDGEKPGDGKTVVEARKVFDPIEEDM